MANILEVSTEADRMYRQNRNSRFRFRRTFYDLKFRLRRFCEAHSCDLSIPSILKTNFFLTISNERVICGDKTVDLTCARIPTTFSLNPDPDQKKKILHDLFLV